MTLHDRIMAINVQSDRKRSDVRSEAAEMAKEADELIAEMAGALSLYVKAGHGMSTDFQKQGDARQAALYALDTYKERNNEQ